MSIRIDGTNTTANPGITGSDTDTGLQFGTNEVKVVTGGTEQATVNSNGQLLVGTTTAPAFTNRRATISTSSGTTALELRSATDGDSRIIFTDSTDSSNTGAYKGQILYDQASDYMSFNTNGNNERLRILSDGTLQLRNSPGIDFSQIQTNASGMTTETLDSYEEGTWTCGVETGTVTSEDARYTRIGNLVHAHVKLTSFSNRSSSNNVIINGLPFSTSINQASGSMFARYLDRTAFTVYTFTTKSEFYSIASGNFAALLHDQLNNANAVLYFQATYLIN